MKKYIVALIPARGGSKSIPDKNIINFTPKDSKGESKPLIVHSIDLAKQSKFIDFIFVSTDSEKIANIAREAGAIVPFLRPSEISGDLSTDLECFQHFLNYLNSENYFLPKGLDRGLEETPLRSEDIKFIIHLRPTFLNRTLESLDNCIEIFNKNYKEYDSLRTVVRMDKSPYKTYNIINNELIPLHQMLINEGKIINEPFNQCRQLLPETFLHNGNIDIVKPNTILNQKSVTGNKIYPVIENENNDLDTFEDLKKMINSK